jgi:hypothetical protein
MEHLLEVVQPYGMLAAGALFGAGWWCWCDVSGEHMQRQQQSLPSCICCGGDIECTWQLQPWQQWQPRLERLRNTPHATHDTRP